MTKTIDIAAFGELIDDYQCSQIDGTLDERSNARSALMNAYRAALASSDAQAGGGGEAVYQYQYCGECIWRDTSKENWDKHKNGVLAADQRFRVLYAAQPAECAPRVDDEVGAFLAEVRAELIRALSKFPGDRIMTIALAEEFGELCKAVLDESAANVRKEAVQTAVMCARVVLDGDGSVNEWRAQKGLDPLVQSADVCPKCTGKGTVLFRDPEEAWDVACGVCNGTGARAIEQAAKEKA